MEVRFFLTSNDLWNFTKYSFKRTRALVLFALIALVLLLLAFVITTTNTSGDALLINLLPLLALVLAIFFLVFVGFPRRLMRVNANRLAMQGQQIVTIGPEGMRIRNNLTDSLLFWPAFKEITADTNNLYFIHHGNRLIANLIPRRAFATPQDADAFLAWARQYQAAALARPPAGPPAPSATYERWG